MTVEVSLFKEVMGNYPTGVTVVTGYNENQEPIGLTVNSFASVSVDPLLILWSIDKSVSTYNSFSNIERFSVNILAEDQKDIAYLFASKGQDRFSNVDWFKSILNLPIILDSLAALQCEVYQTIEAGDHMILIGKVIDIKYGEKKPLLYHKRNMGPIPNSFYEN